MAHSPVLTTGFVNSSGKLIAEGTHFYAYGWGYYFPGVIDTYFLWHVARSRAGNLVLVADGCSKRLPLTLKRLNNLVVYTPAPGLAWTDFPEEWSWWRAHGWGVVIRQVFPLEPGGEYGYEMQAYRQGQARAMHFEADSWALYQKSPHALKRLLGEGLFYVLHSRKAATFGLLGERPLPDEVYYPFVEKMRRKMKKLGIS
jgi:hypothetical protein